MDIPVRHKVAGAFQALSLTRQQLNLFFDERQRLSPPRFWTICALVCIIALLLRLPTLASRSLWLDETYSAWFSAVPLVELWTQVPLYETHPPFYYTLLKAWRSVAGSGEASLRGLSVLASVATVFLVAIAARAARLGAIADRVALLAALFLTVNAGNVQFAQEARPYALQTLAASVAIFFSFMLLAEIKSGAHGRPAGSRSWPCVAGLSLATGLTLWLHNTGVFIAFGIWTGLVVSLLLLIPGDRRHQALLVGVAGLVAILVWLPFLPTFIRQHASMATLAFWVKFKPSDLFSAWVLAAGGKLLEIPAAVLGLAAIASLWHTRRYLVCHLLIILAVAPVTMAAYSYFVKPIFLTRLFEWLAPLVMALLALGVFALRPSMRKPAATVVIALSGFSTFSGYNRPTENWREMLAKIAASARPGDLILTVPNEVQLPIRYYLQPATVPAEIIYLPRPFPAPGLARRYVGNPGAPAVDSSDIDQLRAILPRYRRVWLIERRPDLYDPGKTVSAEIAARFRPVETIDGIGATITLFE
jgi:mannosyltransferase